MSDLFGKIFDMVLKGKGGSAPQPKSAPASLDIGGLSSIFGNLMGKDGKGMSGILRKMVAAGLGSAVKSWVGRGPNHLLTADQVKSSLGDSELSRLAAEHGMTNDQIASLLADHMPDAVDQMTPEGELKNDDGTVIDLTPLDRR